MSRLIDLNNSLNNGFSWEFLALNWTSEPIFLESLSDGDVYSYELNGVTRYRFIPNNYNAMNDSFFENFDNSNLTNLINNRG